jgi:hypothetical protein
MTGLTTWERWEAGLPPRGRDERRRYAEYDATAAGVGEVPARDQCPPGYFCNHNHPGDIPAGIQVSRCRYCGLQIGVDELGIWWADGEQGLRDSQFCAHQPEEES